MKKNVSVSVILAISIFVISMLAVYGISGAASSSSGAQIGTKSSPPPGGSTPASGSAPTGGAPNAPKSELGKKYSLEILAPSGIPVKTIHIKDPKGKISINWDDPEHGPQVLTNACFNGEILMFDALSGTPGDELFHFTLKIYPGGILLGHAFVTGGAQSPVVLKAVE